MNKMIEFTIGLFIGIIMIAIYYNKKIEIYKKNYWIYRKMWLHLYNRIDNHIWLKVVTKYQEQENYINYSILRYMEELEDKWVNK